MVQNENMNDKQLKNYLKTLDKNKIIELYLQMKFERDFWQNDKTDKNHIIELEEQIKELEKELKKVKQEKRKLSIKNGKYKRKIEMNKRTYIVDVNGVRHKHISVVCVAIFENFQNKEFDFKEPVLYLQTRRKMPKNRAKFRGQEYVKEIVYPLRDVTRLL